jgi:hypothetical protein
MGVCGNAIKIFDPKKKIATRNLGLHNRRVLS